MTNRRRTKARRTQPHRQRRAHLLVPHDDDETGFTVGWAQTDDEIPEVQKLTHDTLIKLMGSARTSGVQWQHYRGDGAKGALSMLTEATTSEEHLNLYRRLKGMLREYGGILIIATASGRRDAST